MLIAKRVLGAGGRRIPTEGLVARYELDSSLVDTSGNGFDGTPASEVSYTPGARGSALAGDGANYVSLPALGLGGSTPRTVSVWARRGASTSIKSLVGWSGPLVNGTSCILHVGAVATGDVYWGFGGSDYRTAGGQVTTGAFTHICAVYDGGVLSTSTVRIYINNVSVPLTRVGTGSITPNTANSNYRLQSDALGPRINDGDLDLVRLYNRALPGAEIDDLYREAA
ncbi:MAG: LamG domain-containing protein [Halomonas sp.]|nr:LamG domain-containing protein [Halomonas sp.]